MLWSCHPGSVRRSRRVHRRRRGAPAPGAPWTSGRGRGQRRHVSRGVCHGDGRTRVVPRHLAGGWVGRGVHGDRARRPRGVRADGATRRAAADAAVVHDRRGHEASRQDRERVREATGEFLLTRQNWRDIMHGLPTDRLCGIDAKTSKKLAGLGIRAVAELAGADENGLASAFGPKTGPWLRMLATGDDVSPVTDEPYVPRGRGRERTFQRDLAEPEEIRR